MTAEQCVGVISDTHGLLRDEVRSALEGCDLILHAGDIGSLEVLEALKGITHVVAVRGNVDRQRWSEGLNETEELQADGKRILIIHELRRMKTDPVQSGIDIVVYGHSHQPDIRITKGVLYLNPGSAGPRRFGLPVCLALLRLKGGKAYPEIIEITV